jgi:asparagine synthase (glutamine-hydrolysing)
VLQGQVEDEPYFYARKVDGRFETRGRPACLLGHQLHYPGQDRLDGIYAEWSWDGRRLRVRNDRYGFYPLYYFKGEGEIAVSPSIPRLLALGVPTELDQPGLAVFLRLGFFIGEHTAFRAILALPPDATLEWEGDSPKLSGRIVVRKPERLDRDQVIDAYVALFREAMRRRAPTEEIFTVPLSGGRDSRHILFELLSTGHVPEYCITFQHYPPRQGHDLAAASRLTNDLGIAHVVLHQRESRIQAELRKNIKTNFCSDEHAQYLVLADYLKGRVGLVYDGIAGDVLSASSFLSQYRLELFSIGKLEELASMLLDEEVRASWLLRADRRHYFSRELAMHCLTNELAKHADAPNPIASFYFWNRTRREIALAPYRVYGEAIKVYSPFLDHDLFDLLASIPASLQVDRKLHTDAILRGYPQFAHIPFAPPETGYLSGPNYLGDARRTASDLARFMAEGRTSMVEPETMFYVLQSLLRGRPMEHFIGLAVYLMQLERMSLGGATQPSMA